MASPKSDDQLDWQLLRVFCGFHLVFLGFLHMETRFREKGLICTDLLPQYEAKVHTKTWHLGSTPTFVI